MTIILTAKTLRQQYEELVRVKGRAEAMRVAQRLACELGAAVTWCDKEQQEVEHIVEPLFQNCLYFQQFLTRQK